MSSIDDMLFAPILRRPDFLIRQNRESGAYDWNPLTARAANWVNKHYPNSYARSLNHEGWINNFSHEPNLAGLVKVGAQPDWLDELSHGKYIVERIDVSG